MENDSVSRSWFCVLDNPADHGFDQADPQAVLDALSEKWLEAYPGGSCMLAYCISAEGMPHIHTVLENGRAMRFSAIKKAFPSMHIEPTKGNKGQVEDYINKTGKFEEKGEVIVCKKTVGTIQGSQGKRSDLDEIEALLDEGYTPEEIYAVKFGYRRYDKMIREEYYTRRRNETPAERDVSVFWHVGPSGSGKSHVQVDLREQYGFSKVYVMTDYDSGGLDKYNGEPVLFMDEFRGQTPFNRLLLMLDKYPNQIHARYSNVVALWNDVHITSVLPPECVYEQMVEDHKGLDSYSQLKRRITSVVYHEQFCGEYLAFEMPMSEYTDYEHLREKAHDQWKAFLGNNAGL